PASGPAAVGEPDPPIDYKTKYEEAIKHSREWENRAKANKTAADELKKLKESQMSDAEKYAALDKELTELKTKQQQAEWKTQVSKETGVPADLLRGNSLEELQEHGKALQKALADQRKPKPAGMPKAGSQPSGSPADEEQRAFLRQLFGKN
ncbi:MAG: helicase, partial [Parascardovia denticolens]